MNKYGLGFKKCEDKDTAKSIIAKHGGKLYDAHKYYVSYLSTDESDTEILLELANIGLLS